VISVVFNLRTNKLSGTLPNLGKILPLEELEVRGNFLNGSLPVDITNLSNLKVLSVRENNIGGSIPDGIGRMSALEVLQLRQNELTSTIPSEVGLLTALLDLNIRDNRMIGDIPIEIWNLLNLKGLAIGNSEFEQGNSFRGSIPTAVARMTNLGTSGLDSLLTLICGNMISPVLASFKQRGCSSITSSCTVPFRR
jgi:Leucine-rich repeat (LRR) protein